MKNRKITRIFWLITVIVSMSIASFAQTKRPLFQTITIKPGNETPKPSPTPLVKKTSSTRPVYNNTAPAASRANSMRRTPFAILQSISIPGTSGVLIESEDGRLVLDSYADVPRNPASNVKTSTTYAVLRTFGPNYRFKTGVYTDGAIDRETGTLVGNLYVSGEDPVFAYQHALTIVNELNRMGVAKVEGDIVVTPTFSMNYNASSSRSSALVKRTADGVRRPTSARKAWTKFRRSSGKTSTTSTYPTLSIAGSSRVDTIPSDARLLFDHESAPLREVVKAMMSYSNNFLSERLGRMIGGHAGVERIVRRDIGATPYEFNLDSCSGLGINRVTPRSQMKVIRKLKALLEKDGMRLSDIMPVAGLDAGTLSRRFDDGMETGSVVGKTGTLNQTDRGVSSLAGEFSTRKGKFIFVIFNQRGRVYNFRSFQNSFVPLVQNLLGGAMPMNYNALPMDARLAKSRIVYPNGRMS